MTSFCLIRPGAHRVMPWKNGGGSTAEIAIHPSGASVAAGFGWRLSIATVASDGPFSAFPQHDRAIMLLKGRGMTLDFIDGERAVLDQPHHPLEFDGSRAATCRLIDGPCEDFNLMVARAQLTATIAVRGDAPLPPDDPRDATRLLFVLRGQAECRGPVGFSRAGRPLALGPRDTLVIAPGEAAPAVNPRDGFLAFAATIRLRPIGP